MKKLFFSIEVWCVLLYPLLSHAAVTLTVEYGAALPGESDIVPVSLDNPNDTVKAIQVDISDSDNFLSCLGCSPDPGRAPEFVCSTNELPGGECRVVLISIAAFARIQHGTGPVLTVTYAVSPTAPLGECKSLDMANAVVSDTYGSPLGVTLESGWFCFSSSIDSDGDGVYNFEDNCPEDHNPAQTDTDNDSIGDACDYDDDNDGILDVFDNCHFIANANQSDVDFDFIGDACDVCPFDTYNDVDGDGICGDIDNCPAKTNPDQTDSDEDGTGDACDICTDTDGDGLGNPGFSENLCSVDNCPYDPANDADNDTVCGDVDNCPVTANSDQTDTDNDYTGDVCDNCPLTANSDQTDSDNDSLGDVCDSCPFDADNDIDGDGICGDIDLCPYDPENDFDNDTICGDIDNCPLSPNGPGNGTCMRTISSVIIGMGAACSDNSTCKTLDFCQMEQGDFNVNGIGDACECYSDFDNSTAVDIFDLTILKNEYNRTACNSNPCDADSNDDGKVDIFDLAVMKNQYTRSGCPVLE